VQALSTVSLSGTSYAGSADVTFAPAPSRLRITATSASLLSRDGTNNHAYLPANVPVEYDRMEVGVSGLFFKLAAAGTGTVYVEVY
jgi:hypothetical protein